MLRVAQLLAQLLKRGRIFVVAIDIPQKPRQLFPSTGIDAAAVFFEAVFRARFQLVQIPARFRDADHRHIEVTAFDHRLQRRENLLVGEVAGGAKENQSVGLHCSHVRHSSLI